MEALRPLRDYRTAERRSAEGRRRRQADRWVWVWVHWVDGAAVQVYDSVTLSMRTVGSGSWQQVRDSLVAKNTKRFGLRRTKGEDAGHWSKKHCRV
ncbi:hypothetical protein PS2_014053 [Malus domestica]